MRCARLLKVGVIAQSAAGRNAQTVLLNRLSLVPEWLGERLGRFEGVTAAGTGVRLRARRRLPLASMLRRRARLRPLLLALDEAHKMDPELGLELLNAVQDVQGENRPVMLLLAGTPDLPRHLNTIGASFWDRSEKLPIGRLGPQDSANAVRIPLEEGGRSIDADALDAVVRTSHGYPYFLQLWGRALWDGCPAASEPISLDAIQRAQPRFQWARNLFYVERYRELQEAELLTAAGGVAAAFAGSEWATAQQISKALQESLDREGLAGGRESVNESQRLLCDLGYIWLVDRQSQPGYEPGIPSLMRYVERAVRDDGRDGDSGFDRT